jgi:hypothetical protein
MEQLPAAEPKPAATGVDGAVDDERNGPAEPIAVTLLAIV